MVEKTQVAVTVRTREALRNLFGILDIRGDTFDDQLYELASRAFAGSSTVFMDHNKGGLERIRSAHKKPRRRIDIKATTYSDLQDLHARLLPYISWRSWDWYLNHLMRVARLHVHDKMEDVLTYKLVGED